MARSWFLVRNETRASVVAEAAELADGFVSRLRGLLGRQGLPPGHGLWIDPCNSVHTFFMRFAIDVAFLDSELRVVRVVPDLRPGRLTRVHWTASTCLELAAGAFAQSGTLAGDQLRFQARDLP